MKLYLILFFLILSLASFSQSQTEMNIDAGGQLEKAEENLEATYSAIFREYKTDTAFIDALVRSKDIWANFRDAELEMKFPIRERGYYGSVQPMCVAFYLASLTNQRIETLKEWLDGIEEGDACEGSVKMK